jgi:hypothetical protein
MNPTAIESIEVIYVSLQDRVTFSHRQGDRGGLFFELRQTTSCSECSELNRRCSGAVDRKEYSTSERVFYCSCGTIIS